MAEFDRVSERYRNIWPTICPIHHLLYEQHPVYPVDCIPWIVSRRYRPASSDLEASENVLKLLLMRNT